MKDLIDNGLKYGKWLLFGYALLQTIKKLYEQYIEPETPKEVKQLLETPVSETED